MKIITYFHNLTGISVIFNDKSVYENTVNCTETSVKLRCISCIRMTIYCNNYQLIKYKNSVITLFKNSWILFLLSVAKIWYRGRLKGWIYRKTYTLEDISVWRNFCRKYSRSIRGPIKKLHMYLSWLYTLSKYISMNRSCKSIDCILIKQQIVLARSWRFVIGDLFSYKNY